MLRNEIIIDFLKEEEDEQASVVTENNVTEKKEPEILIENLD